MISIKKHINHFFILHILLFVSTQLFSQKEDSTINLKKEIKVIAAQKHDPRIATRRSLILPGWGQAYNKEYWKIPIVYGALSIPTITFIYNNNIYKESKYAYDARIQAKYGATHSDSISFFSLETKYQRADINSIQTLRNAARRDRDYSVLWFLIVWGLNVADATVFGHLKDFDVSSNLSMTVRPNFNPTTRTPGLGFTFKLKDKKVKCAFMSR